MRLAVCRGFKISPNLHFANSAVHSAVRKGMPSQRDKLVCNIFKGLIITYGYMIQHNFRDPL